MLLLSCPSCQLFKIVGTFNCLPNLSTFHIDLVLQFLRKYMDEDMPALVTSMKDSFYKFIRNSYKYTTPFEHHTSQTVFYSMTQTNIRMLETVQFHRHINLQVEIPDGPSTSNEPDNSQEGILQTAPILSSQGQLHTSDGKILMPPPMYPHPPLTPFDITFTSNKKRSLSPTEYLNTTHGKDY